MKTINVVFRILVLALTIQSCGNTRSSFNKQKYTTLKKLKVSNTSIIEEEITPNNPEIDEIVEINLDEERDSKITVEIASIDKRKDEIQSEITPTRSNSSKTESNQTKPWRLLDSSNNPSTVEKFAEKSNEEETKKEKQKIWRLFLLSWLVIILGAGVLFLTWPLYSYIPMLLGALIIVTGLSLMIFSIGSGQNIKDRSKERVLKGFIFLSSLSFVIALLGSVFELIVMLFVFY